jgi:hypothetical protein
MSGWASNATIIVIKQVTRMQTNPPKKTGRPLGRRSINTMRSAALKELEAIMKDSSVPPETRAFAAAKLIDEAKA